MFLVPRGRAAAAHTGWKSCPDTKKGGLSGLSPFFIMQFDFELCKPELTLEDRNMGCIKSRDFH